MQCKKCDGSATTTVVAGVSVFAAVVGLFACRLFRAKGRGVKVEDADWAEEASQIGVFAELVAKYQPPAKILLSYYQIVCGLGFVYDLRFPKFFTNAINWVSTVVNLDFVSFMPLGCMAETSFYHSLLGYTLGPL